MNRWNVSARDTAATLHGYDLVQVSPHLRQLLLLVTDRRALHAARLEPVQLAPALVELAEQRLDQVLARAAVGSFDCERAHAASLTRPPLYVWGSSATGAGTACGLTSATATSAPDDEEPEQRVERRLVPVVERGGAAGACAVEVPSTVAAIALAAAMPIAPPICRLVLTSPEATPASARFDSRQARDRHGDERQPHAGAAEDEGREQVPEVVAVDRQPGQQRDRQPPTTSRPAVSVARTPTRPTMSWARFETTTTVSAKPLKATPLWTAL